MPFPKGFKPLLAASCDDVSALRFPLLATPKIDGIRALVCDGRVYSRSLKLIPNRYVQEMLNDAPNGLDGELVVPGTFQDVTSCIMSADGEPGFIFKAFDMWDLASVTYVTRAEVVKTAKHPYVEPLNPVVIRNRDELEAYFAESLAAGHEGVMVRRPNGPYKMGRSTFNEHTLIKLKPFEDDEATVIGFEEQLRNDNVATKNALGRTERSSHKENLIGKGTLGALVVTHPTYGEFRIGTGLNDYARYRIWTNQKTFLGQIVKFRYQKIGTKDKPRIPSFLGFRHNDDL